MGKTSLLAQGPKQTRTANRRLGMTDFQKFNTAQMASDETFYRLLAATLAKQLKFTYDFANEWDEIFGANLNMETFLRALLDSPGRTHPSGLWTRWTNSSSRRSPPTSSAWCAPGTTPGPRAGRPLEQADRRHRLRHRSASVHSGPESVAFQCRPQIGTGRLQPAAGNRPEQTGVGSPLRSYQEVERLYALIAGQPFLTRRGLDALATGKYDFNSFFTEADRDDGPFNDHLKRILVSVSNLPAVLEYVTALLQVRPCPIGTPTIACSPPEFSSRPAQDRPSSAVNSTSATCATICYKRSN